MIPYVYYVGKAVGELLADNGFIAENIYLVAHSTGSHITGYICETYTAKTGKRVRRFRYVEPSAPCFIGVEDQDKVVKPGIAEYVESSIAPMSQLVQLLCMVIQTTFSTSTYSPCSLVVTKELR